MSRPYVVVLFLFGSAILSSLVYLHFHLMERQHAELIAITLDVQERSVEALGEDVRHVVVIIAGELDDSSKERYLPLIEIVDKVNQQVKEYLKQVELQESSISELQISVGNRLKAVVDLKESILRENYSNLDMSESNLEEELLDLNDLMGRSLTRFSENYTLENDPTGYDWAEGLITEGFLLNCRKLLQRTNRLIRRPCFDIDNYFPIVTSSRGYVESGKRTELKLAVGTFTYVDPENVEYLVNGERIPLGYDGLANYNFVPKGKGHGKAPSSAKAGK